MSTTKGESILDTVRTLEAMHTDLFVVRDHASGTPHLIADHLPGHVRVINAGDGRHAHPTQAMLDMFTIRREKGDFSRLRVAIVGDLLHSRVARSQIQALSILGTREIRVIGPRTLIPTDIQSMGVNTTTDMTGGLDDIDVIIMLRIQRERMDGQLIPSEQEFFSRYGLTEEKTASGPPRRHRHASRAHQPGTGDRFQRGRQQPFGHSRPGHQRDSRPDVDHGPHHGRFRQITVFPPILQQAAANRRCNVSSPVTRADRTCLHSPVTTSSNGYPPGIPPAAPVFSTHRKHLARIRSRVVFPAAPASCPTVRRLMFLEHACHCRCSNGSRAD